MGDFQKRIFMEGDNKNNGVQGWYNLGNMVWYWGYKKR